jgi:acetyltransferase-like isoleucine patch superfamily enzyme
MEDSLLRKIILHGMSLLKVMYYRIKYRILGKRVQWGKRIKIWGKLVIDGPGRVIIGSGTVLDGSARPVTPFTHSAEAILEIGRNCFVNGTRFGCMNRISIGDGCLLGEASIMDTDFHPVDPDARRRDEPGKTGTVSIGENVWLGGGVVILKNTVIGADSTVGAMAVVTGSYPERSLIVGNPAVLKRILSRK